MRFFNLFSLIALIISAGTLYSLFYFVDIKITEEQEIWYGLQGKTLDRWEALLSKQEKNYQRLNKALDNDRDLSKMKSNISSQRWQLDMLLYQLIEVKLSCYRAVVYLPEKQPITLHEESPGLIAISEMILTPEFPVPTKQLRAIARLEIDNMKKNKERFSMAKAQCGKL